MKNLKDTANTLKRSETSETTSGLISNTVVNNNTNNNQMLNKTKSEEFIKGSSSLNTVPKRQQKMTGTMGLLQRVDTPSTPINNNETNNTMGKAIGNSSKSINERLNEL